MAYVPRGHVFPIKAALGQFLMLLALAQLLGGLSAAPGAPRPESCCLVTLGALKPSPHSSSRLWHGVREGDTKALLMGHGDEKVSGGGSSGQVSSREGRPRGSRERSALEAWERPKILSHLHHSPRTSSLPHLEAA